ncbi:MAG: B12-binding domain-containing radical SAM protein [Bryobacteraceae bacterium]
MNIALIGTDNDLWVFGVRLISSVLKRAGHSTRLILLASDAAEYPAQVLDEVRELARPFDLVGISCCSRGSRQARQIAAGIQTLGKPMVWGGLHATLNPAECAEAAGIVCRGEGEETILELLESLEDGRNWEEIRNLAYCKGGMVVLNPLRPPVANLDSLPLPDFERTDEFHLSRGRLTKAPSDPRLAHSPRMQYIGSRGCALHCTYCCNRKLKDLYGGNGGYLRRMSPAKYVEHLAILHRRYFPNATDVFLHDQDFFLRSLEEIREFAQLYRTQVGLPFDCMVSPPRVADEKVRLLAEAGLWRISLGLESGSERTKKQVFDRPVPNETVLRASRAIKKHPSVTPCYYVIVGNPYEDRQDLLDTLGLMTRLEYPYYADIYNLVFFPGSELFDRAVRDGMIAGTRDSGVELHFRAGLQYRKHAWKQSNLYLNALLFLTEGKATRRRLGLLPRGMIPFLTRPAVIDFMDRQRTLCRIAIASKVLLLRTRARVGAVLKSLVKNPADAYNLPRYLKRKFA